MPRPPKKRRVGYLPQITYFKPAGIPLRKLEEVRLTVDEIEALRLKDVEGLDQQDAALRMKVAQSTFQRILVAARAKVARAIIEGKAIRIEGGCYYLTDFTRCPRCMYELPAVEGGEEAGGEGQARAQTHSCPRCGEILERGGFHAEN